MKQSNAQRPSSKEPNVDEEDLGLSNNLNRFINDLGLKELKLKKNESETKEIKNLKKVVPIVKFEDPYKIRRAKQEEMKGRNKSSAENEETPNEFNMRKARHEVLKFGISGFDRTEKQEAKVALAISLGAKVCYFMNLLA